MRKKDVVAVVGPTASGKTKIAIDIAKEIDGEIISADSMQIYKGMDIGTAKPTLAEMQGIKHNLLDEVEVNQEFSVAMFKQKALFLVEDILMRKKMPIICGGTGLYINSITHDLDFGQTKGNLEFRDKLKDLSRQKGNEYLHDLLKQKNADAAARIHKNDLKRIIRALETVDSGEEFNFAKENRDYNYIIIGINQNRQELYKKINSRVDEMIELGLLKEVEKLYENYDQNLNAMKAIGYSQLIEYFNGDVGLKDAISNIKRDSRRYAKRQITWFKRDKRIKWFDKGEYSSYDDFSKDIIDYIKNMTGKKERVFLENL